MSKTSRASQSRFARVTARDRDLLRWRYGRGYVAELVRGQYERLFAGGRRVLDVGCGVGEAAIFAAGAAYVGVDLSEALVRGGAGRPGRALVVGNVLELPFADGAFDRVACRGMLHHLAGDDLSAALREMARVLAPGGLMGLVEPNPWNPAQRLLAYVSPAERGILHTSVRRLRRALAAAPALDLIHFEWDHVVVALGQLTLWRLYRPWATSPSVTRACLAIHRLARVLTPPPLRALTVWRLRKTGGAGPGADGPVSA